MSSRLKHWRSSREYVHRDSAAAEGEEVTMLEDKKDTGVKRNTLIRRLRELIEAIERRVPHPERKGEIRIARDSAALKKKALERIAQTET